MENKTTLNLTVVIPTYNRKEALIRLLKSFLNVDYQIIDEIIISDNQSSYDIINTLKQELPHNLFQKCNIIINRHNIGGQGNINNSFLLPKTKWMWLIGDDDTITDNALTIIARDIKNNSDCAWFKYSTANINAIEENVTIHNLSDFINYYTIHKRHLGNLVFMSNNIFNIEKLSPYIIYAFEYSYTFVSQILPPLMGLNKEEIYIKYRSDSICNYTIPDNENQWNCIKIFLGNITIEDLPIEFRSPQEQSLFKQLFTFWPFITFSRWLEANWSKIPNKNFILKICNSLYFPHFNFKEWIIFLLLWLRIRTKLNLFSIIINSNLLHKIFGKQAK